MRRKIAVFLLSRRVELRDFVVTDAAVQKCSSRPALAATFCPASTSYRLDFTSNQESR